MNHRCRRTGEGIKPPKGAVLKSHGAERLGKVTPRVCQVWIKELNVSEPLMTGREGVQSVKSYEVHDGVISLAATCLLAKRQASYRGQELYSGLVTELENLHVDDRLSNKQSGKKADSQREMHNRLTLEAKYRRDMQGQTNP
jgi:hypothetical protein